MFPFSVHIFWNIISLLYTWLTFLSIGFSLNVISSESFSRSWNEIQPSIIDYKKYSVISQPTADHVLQYIFIPLSIWQCLFSLYKSLTVAKEIIIFLIFLHYFSQGCTEWNVCSRTICLVKGEWRVFFVFVFAGFVFPGTCFYFTSWFIRSKIGQHDKHWLLPVSSSWSQKSGKHCCRKCILILTG